jgi:hypothetical protein
MKELEPLSPRLRRLTLIIFGLLWLVLVPVVTRYADGWRFKSGVGLLQTGGIFVYSPLLDARIEVDGQPAGTSSLLNRGLYIQDLVPSVYKVDVSKDGYRDWHRDVVVEPHIVTEVTAFLVPTEIRMLRLTTLAASTTASTTRRISADEREAYLAVFATPVVASSTIPVATQRSMGLFIVRGDLVARWLGGAVEPAAFCGRPSYCAKEFLIAHDVTRAVFFADGIVFRTKRGEIWYAEADMHADAVRAKIYAKTGADMSVFNGELIIKDGQTLYTVQDL